MRQSIGVFYENAKPQAAAFSYNHPMIRKATPDDTQQICELIRALAVYERLSHEVKFDEDKVQDYLFGERPFAETLLADEDGDVAGFALFFHTYSTFAGKPGIYLEDLFVKPEHRGKGHGKALLAELAKIAVERDCCSVKWSVLDWNQPSIDFYKSLGAVPMDEWLVYALKGDALKSVSESKP